MSYSQAVDPRLSNLTALVESIVDQMLGGKLNKQLTSWMVSNPQISSHLSYQRDPTSEGNSQVLASIARLGNTLGEVGKYSKAEGLQNFGAKLQGVAGIANAYQNGDPLGGAMAGAQLGTALSSGVAAGPIGAAVGFLAGIFGKSQTIDKWDRPKFTAAKQAYETQFVVDRGEQNPYYLPDSFYFRTGSTGKRQLVVKIGNEQLNDHIRESLTNSYASQLQRGLVF